MLTQNGSIRGTLLAFQFMSKDKGNGGLIVNVGSSCSVKPFVSSPIYTATKHAIIGLTKAYGVSWLVLLLIHWVCFTNNGRVKKRFKFKFSEYFFEERVGMWNWHWLSFYFSSSNWKENLLDERNHYIHRLWMIWEKKSFSCLWWFQTSGFWQELWSP